MNTLVTLTMLWMAHFLVDFMVGVWSVFKTISGLDIGMAGLIAGACGLMGEGSQIFFGPLTDRGYKKILIVFGLLMSASCVMLAGVNTYLLFFLLYLLTCIGSGAFHPPAVALTGSLTDSRKGMFIAIFSTGGSLGLALSQILFAKTHTYFNGSTLILLIPTVLLALLYLSIGFWKKEPKREGSPPIPFGREMFRTYFKDPSLRTLYCMQVCNQTLSWAAIFILPDILASRGYSEEIAFGGGHMVYILGGVLMMIPSGLLADRFSARSVILTASTTGMVLFFTFLSLPFLPTLYLLPLLAVVGASLGLVQPVAVALGNKLGKKNPGLVSAFTMGMVWCVAEMVGPGTVGLLTKFFSEDAPAKALMTMGILYPVLILAAFKLPQVEEELVLAPETPSTVE